MGYTILLCSKPLLIIIVLGLSILLTTLFVPQLAQFPLNSRTQTTTIPTTAQPSSQTMTTTITKLHPSLVRLLIPQQLFINGKLAHLTILSGQESPVDFSRRPSYDPLINYIGTPCTLIYLKDYGWPSPEHHKGMLLQQPRTRNGQTWFGQDISFFQDVQYVIRYQWAFTDRQQIAFLMVEHVHLQQLDSKVAPSDGPIQTFFLYKHTNLWQPQIKTFKLIFKRSLASSRGNGRGVIITGISVQKRGPQHEHQIAAKCIYRSQEQKVHNGQFSKEKQNRFFNPRRIGGWSGAVSYRPLSKYVKDYSSTNKRVRYIAVLDKSHGLLKQDIEKLIPGNMYLLTIVFGSWPSNKGSMVKIFFDKVILQKQISYKSTIFTSQIHEIYFYARHQTGRLEILNEGGNKCGIGIVSVSITKAHNGCLINSPLDHSGMTTRSHHPHQHGFDGAGPSGLHPHSSGGHAIHHDQEELAEEGVSEEKKEELFSNIAESDFVDEHQVPKIYSRLHH